MAKKQATIVEDEVQPEPVQAAKPDLYLDHGYRGRKSNEAYIPAGLYPWGDPVLMGLEAYLIENGHAVEVKD